MHRVRGAETRKTALAVKPESTAGSSLAGFIAPSVLKPA